MKPLMKINTNNKNNLLFILLPVVVLVIYFSLFHTGKSDADVQKKEKKAEGIIIPDVKESKQMNSVEARLYEMRAKKKEELSTENSKIEEDDFFDVNAKQKVEAVEEIEVEQKSEPVKTVTKSSVAKKSSSTKTSKTTSSASSGNRKESNDMTDAEAMEYYGIGTSSNGTTQPQQGTTKSSSSSNKFIKAFLEENSNLKSGRQVSFIVKEDGYVNGTKINKMARLYGTVSQSGNRFMVTVNKVLNTDGKTYNIALNGYDENFQKGIYYEGKLDDVLNESINSTAEDVGGMIGLRNVGRTASKAVKQEPELPLTANYIMYFKEETR